MSVFDFATVAASFILGLAVAYLLESMVEAFLARRRCRLDWVPFVWVAIRETRAANLRRQVAAVG